jgi:Holliday junction resolvase-like predicted endonuclease
MSLTPENIQKALLDASVMIKTGELDIITESVNGAVRPRYDGLNIVQFPNYFGKLERIHFYRNQNVIFAANIHTERVEMKKSNSIFDTARAMLTDTEEMCFQNSLVNEKYIDYETLQIIKSLVQYGIDNYNDPEDFE